MISPPQVRFFIACFVGQFITSPRSRYTGSFRVHRHSGSDASMLQRPRAKGQSQTKAANPKRPRGTPTLVTGLSAATLRTSTTRRCHSYTVHATPTADREHQSKRESPTTQRMQSQCGEYVAPPMPAGPSRRDQPLEAWLEASRRFPAALVLRAPCRQRRQWSCPRNLSMHTR